MEIDLKKLGVHVAEMPKSMATSLDFVSIWGAEPNRAQLGRLCAAVIAVCVDHARVLPAYPVATGDPIAFGHKCLDRLLGAGVGAGDIYEMGSTLLIKMLEEIPKEEAVEEQANFTSPPEET
jgi:hypothetical protein